MNADRRTEILRLAGAELARSRRRRRTLHAASVAVSALALTALLLWQVLPSSIARTVAPVARGTDPTPIVPIAPDPIDAAASAPLPRLAVVTVRNERPSDGFHEVVRDEDLARELARLSEPRGVAIVAGQVRLVPLDGAAPPSRSGSSPVH